MKQNVSISPSDVAQGVIRMWEAMIASPHIPRVVNSIYENGQPISSDVIVDTIYVHINALSRLVGLSEDALSAMQEEVIDSMPALFYSLHRIGTPDATSTPISKDIPVESCRQLLDHIKSFFEEDVKNWDSDSISMRDIVTEYLSLEPGFSEYLSQVSKESCIVLDVIAHAIALGYYSMDAVIDIILSECDITSVEIVIQHTVKYVK